MSGVDIILSFPDVLKKLEDSLDVITRLASKLKADPHAAAVKLTDALGELKRPAMRSMMHSKSISRSHSTRIKRTRVSF